MKRKDLLSMRQLKATPAMLAAAREDVPKKVNVRYGSYAYSEMRQNYWLFLRCCIENSILKVALYSPDALRAGGRLPVYELYIDREARKFITYDPIRQRWLHSKLDRLNWLRCSTRAVQTWMSAADSKSVAKYLCSEKEGYNAILSYQMEIREEERLRRYKRETDPWDADMALTPDLPTDWSRWVDKVGIPQNYIFYKYERKGAKQGYCSYCGKDISLRETPRHNKQGRCPCCRHEIIYKAVGRLGRWFTTDEVCVYLIQARPDGFMVREFWASRRYEDKDYKNPNVSCMEHWRTIYAPDLTRRTYYWGCYKQLNVRWIKGFPSGAWMGSNSIYNYHGCQPGRIYGRNLPHLRQNALRRTGLLEWIYQHDMTAYPDGYLYTRSAFPLFEQIWKAGLSCLAHRCLQSWYQVQSLVKNPNASGLAKALGIDKQELSRLRRRDGDCDYLCWLQMEKASGKPISDDVIQWFYDHDVKAADLKFILGKMSPLQIRNYVQRQAASSRESVRQVLITWQDYLSMAERLGIDTNDEIVYRVKLLHQRHEELLMRCKRMQCEDPAAEVLKNFPNVDRICHAIKEKYEYSDGQYTIIAPDGALDIIVEGEMQCHCLGSSDRYWDRIERQETFILFLRKTSSPDHPYYTLEVEPDGTIRQKRTKFDRQEADIKEATKFLAEWQKVVTKRLTMNDRKKAAASRVLREQEFEQMRKDNVIIRTGDLAGRRLVDVLMADLMENAA